MQLSYYLDKRQMTNDLAIMKIRITDRNSSAYISIGIKLKPSFWDQKAQKVKSCKNSLSINTRLDEIKADVQKFIYEKTKQGYYKSAKIQKIKNDIQDAFFSGSNSHSDTGDFLRIYNEKMNEYSGTSYDSYQTVIKHISDYTDIDHLSMSDINQQWMIDFHEYLLTTVSVNSANHYIVMLRTVYLYALEKDYIHKDEVKRIHLKNQRTRKRSLSLEQLAYIRDYKTTYPSRRNIDIFILLFYLRGISICDLLKIENKDVVDGRIMYERSKTGTLYSVKIEPEAQAIIDKYKGEKYMLNYLDKGKDIQCVNKTINTSLCNIKDKDGKQYIEGLSTYWARHSWATVAHKLGYHRDDISIGLGHKIRGGNDVTDIYIRYEYDEADSTNRAVIDALNNTKSK